MNSDGVGAVTGEQDQQRGLVPKLRFPEFRDAGDWNREILGDLISTVTPPKKLQTTQYAASGTFPIIDQSQDFIAGWTDDTGAVISAELPLIVFGDHTCVLKFIEVPFAQGADGIKIFGTKSRISREYLYQSLQHNPLVMEDYRRHFSILKDRTVDFSDINLGEQQKVADCLSSIDALISAEAGRLDALREHKRGLMQQLFPAPGETTPRLRFPEFQDSAEWEEKEVGDIFTVTRGNVLAMTLVEDVPTDRKPYPVYSSQTKRAGLAGYYSDFLYENAITWTTDGANAGDVNYRAGKFYCTNVCGVLISRDGYANACVAAIINSVSKSHVSYVGNPKLMNGVMAKIMVPLPSVEEQAKIALCLSSADALITAQGNKIDILKVHKRGLMQQLFPVADEVQA